MKKNICLTCICALCFVFAVACDDDDDSDTTKPVINLIEPAEGDSLRIGNAVHFEMELSDDVKLSSYKVEIHSNFDGHSHTRTEAFAFNQTWDVSDKRNTTVHHHEIVISDNATEGDYHLMVYCTDAAGNESYVARDIVLSNTCSEDTDEE